MSVELEQRYLPGVLQEIADLIGLPGTLKLVEAYGAMLWTVARVKSAADLDWAGRKKVIDHLKAGGFKIKSRPAPAANKAGLVSKIRALLIAAGNKPDAYADGMARHMFHIERFEWCDPAQLRKIIAALGYQQKRAEAAKKGTGNE